MKKVYHAPVIETEKLFEVWGLTSPNADGTYTHPNGGKCKD